MNHKDFQNLTEIYQNLYERPGGEQTKSQRQKDIEARGGKDTGITAKIGGAIRDFLNPPASKSADPVVRQGGKYTGPGGAPEFPKSSSSSNSTSTVKPSDGFRGTPAPPSGGGSSRPTPTPTRTPSSGSRPTPTPTPSSGGGSSRPATPTPSRPSRPAPVSLGAERRTPTSSELRAAQSARSQAKAAGASRLGAEKAAVRAGIANKAPMPKATPKPQVSGIKSNRLATALSGVKPFKAEEFDAFDLVLAYLVSEGHVETLDEALYVMMELSEETICGIVEELIN